jgi:hypothetical protein
LTGFFTLRFLLAPFESGRCPFRGLATIRPGGSFSEFPVINAEQGPDGAKFKPSGNRGEIGTQEKKFGHKR